MNPEAAAEWRSHIAAWQESIEENLRCIHETESLHDGDATGTARVDALRMENDALASLIHHAEAKLHK